MSSFPLKIVTPNGLVYHGQADKIIVRTTEGDLAILSRHMDCGAILDHGRITVVTPEGTRCHGVCTGGILSVSRGDVTLLSTGFTWSEK